MRTALCIAACLLLAGCPMDNVRPPPPPQVVTVTITKTVKVPDALDRDCDPVPKQKNTYGEAKRLANARGASLEECTGRMRQIRQLGEKRP